MKNHAIRVKQPQLVRKQTQVVLPKNVSIIIRPSRAQAVQLKDLKKPAAQPVIQVQQNVQPVQSLLPAAAITRQKLIKSRRTNSVKKPQIKYVTHEASPESINRIARLKGLGKKKILIIVGNGPSILEADLDKLKNNPAIHTLSVNKPDSRLWPTDYWAFFDSSQLRRNEDLWNGYNGLIFNSTGIKRQKHNSMQFKNISGKGWSRDMLTGVHIGRSSVYAAMQIGMWMDYEHIYIFGCDMNPDGIDGKLHFYGQNPDVDPERRKKSFAAEAVFYDNAADTLNVDERSKFTFCSTYNKWPFIDKYGQLDHRKAVDHILKHAITLGTNEQSM